ncbi:MAG TPA: flagellar hook-basal body complex protein FliE [Psychromonas hadalis]|nr:flagellar hook-basal body complex protein FliE [Psychromonas hadalis]
MNLNNSALFTNMQIPSLNTSMEMKPLENSALPKVDNNATQFSDMLKQAIDNVNGLQSNTSELRNRFEMGDKEVSLGGVMITANKSSLAFDATIQISNKMVEAYKQVMSMPV